jgi:glyoxylase-like metal-dependent hydrolase (beta-lactamase superfamily II)
VRWERFGSRRWDMSSLVLRGGDEVVLVDPGVDADEVAAIRASAARDGGRVTAILVTHSDWDHVVGIAAFPEAVAWAAPVAAERVRDGGAGRRLEEAARTLGIVIAGPPRVDQVLEPGEAVRVGPLEVRTLELPGHTDCSAAFELPALGLLLAGDYLSPVEFPTLDHSATLYRRTLETLLALLAARPELTVVPGHGPPMDAARATEIGTEDLAYLRAVHAAAAQALAGGLPTGDAVDAGAAVEPPRPAEGDPAPARRRTAELEVAEILGAGPEG